MLGMVETAGGGGGGGGGSNISTPSPTLVSSMVNVRIPVELFGLTFMTIRFPRARRGSSSILELGMLGSACVSSRVEALKERLSPGSFMRSL